MRFVFKNPEKVDWANFRVPQNIIEQVDYCKKIAIHDIVYSGEGFVIEENLRQNNPKYQVRDKNHTYPIHIPWMLVRVAHEKAGLYYVEVIIYLPGYAGIDSRKYAHAQFTVGPNGMNFSDMQPVNIQDTRLGR